MPLIIQTEWNEPQPVCSIPICINSIIESTIGEHVTPVKGTQKNLEAEKMVCVCVPEVHNKVLVTFACALFKLCDTNSVIHL